MVRKGIYLMVIVGFLFAVLGLSSAPVMAKPSKCETCHAKITPGIVKDFNRGKMAEELTCADCHGSAHTSAADV